MLEDMLPAALSSNIHCSLLDAVLRPRAFAGSWGAAGAAGASEAGATDGPAASEASLLTAALPLDDAFRKWAGQEARGISSRRSIGNCHKIITSIEITPWNGTSFASSLSIRSLGQRVQYVWPCLAHILRLSRRVPLNRTHAKVPRVSTNTHDLGSHASCVTSFVRDESSTSSHAGSGGMSTCMLEREMVCSDTTFPIYFPI